MKNLFVLLFVFLLCGCVSRIEKAETCLKPGMSKDEVFAIMGYPDSKSIWDRKIEYWYNKGYSGDSMILVFDKYDRYMYWRSPQGGASSSSSDSQLDAINTSIQDLNTTIQTNEVMRRNGL